ncbi:hypothetical protein [Chroococcidiopsis sp.]|uniref:hypothetical protein n=1 Tax=Chroococcidiopsis sp. TaxID=3088168 RepID=UPI003F2C5132
MLGYIRTDDDKYLLTIDGVVIASQAAEVATSYFRDLSVDLWTPELCEHIILLSAEEILNDSFDYVRFHQSFFWKNDFESFSIDWISVSHNGDSNFQLAIWFTFDVNNWKQPWSMYEYMEEFKLVFDRQDFTNAKCCWLEKDGDTIHVRDGYSISFDIKEPFAPIEIEIERALSILNEVHKQAIYNLSSMAYSNAVTV